MKNITELKKEIERKNKKHRKKAKRLNIEPLGDGGWDDTIEPEAELKILQEVCKEMKKVFKREIELQTVGTDTIDKIEELLKKFQGEEK